MELIYVAGIIGWVLSASKWADWSRFVEFRASIYIVIIGNLLYNSLTDNRHLWTFESPTFHFSHHIIDITLAFFAYPSAIMIFLSHYPENGFRRQVMYNAVWVAMYSSNELLVLWLGAFSHHHGWNIGWSLFLNSISFPFIRLHQRRPVLAIFVFIFCTLMFSFLFRLPIVFEQEHSKFAPE